MRVKNMSKQNQDTAAIEAGVIEETRRRLLKGAAMTAPVILTLRSGSLLAAVSCTGVGPGSTASYDPTDPDTQKYCVPDTSVNTDCPQNAFGSKGVKTLDIGQNIYPATTRNDQGFLTDGNGNYIQRCEGGLILSSSAYDSLT